jgi:hypothetical protein
MRNSIIAAIGSAAVAAAIGGTGLALASSHGATTQTEHFQLMSTSTTSRNSNVIAYGAFTGAGMDKVTSGSTDTVTLPGGTFVITHKDVSHTQHFNPATCLFQFSGKATYKLSNGTGTYQGLSGSGTATVSVTGIGARDSAGHCSQSLPPVAQQQIIQASGPVTLP